MYIIILGVIYGIFVFIFFVWRGINFEIEFLFEVVYFFLVIYFVRIFFIIVLVWEKDLKVFLMRVVGIFSFGVFGLFVGEVGYFYGVFSEYMYVLVLFVSVLGIFVFVSIGFIFFKFFLSG